MYLFHNVVEYFFVYHQFGVVEIFRFSMQLVQIIASYTYIGTYLRIIKVKNPQYIFFNWQKKKTKK